MNAKRYVARQLIHALGTHMRVDYHELYRLAKGPDAEGLTDKEQAFLLKTLTELDAVCNRLAKFGQHIQKGLE